MSAGIRRRRGNLDIWPGFVDALTSLLLVMIFMMLLFAVGQFVPNYRKALLRHKEIDSRVRALRETVRDLKKTYDKTEDDLKSLQSVGQIIGEVLRQLDDERCELQEACGLSNMVSSSAVLSVDGLMSA